MEELITNIAAKMGIDEALAQKAVSVILSLVQSQGEEGPVAELFDKIPGASELAETGGEALSSGGGGLMGKVGGMLGGGIGEAMSAVSSLQSEGLDTGQIRELGGEVVNYAKEQGGEDLVKQVMSSIPGLDRMF